MTITLTSDLLVFAEERKTVQDRHEKALIGSAKYALRHWGQRNWYKALLDRASSLLRKQFHEDTGKWTSPALREAQKQFRADIEKTMKATTKPTPSTILNSAKMIAASIATDATNLAAELAAKDDPEPNPRFRKTWVSMEDEKVRPTHAAAHGQSVGLDEKFTVGEAKMTRPGDMTAPIGEWANCRCLLAMTLADEAVAASLVAATDPTGGDMADDDDFAPPDEPLDIVEDPVPFWGVLAPEDVESGDGRMFGAGSLRSRPLPLPLAYQRVNEPGHDGSVKVANIERTWRKNGMAFGSGHFLTSEDLADEIIAIMAESGGRSGVSVDADDGAAEMRTRDGRSIEDMMEEMEPGDEIELDLDELVTVFTTARIAGATLCNIPAFHEAFIALGDVPEEFAPGDGDDLAIEARADEALSAAARMLAFAPGTQDGPGWLTHPIDTDRLRDYWVHGKGAAKIGWGAPGDFNRCRMHLAKYVKPNHLAGYCANRHKDALGFWPGEHHSADVLTAAAIEPRDGEEMAPSVHLVAAAIPVKPPAAWFEDPELVGPSPIVVTEEGEFYGHLAKWGTCHIGFDGVCIEPPHSMQDYAQFKTKYVLADNGEMIPTGVLTMDTGHAEIKLSARPAAAHYDNTGTVTCDVNIGEDEYGIWVHGAVRPETTEEQLRKIRGSVLSGDWRDIAGNLELVAALHVNVGGFPVERVAIAASGGRQTALVAAGLVLTAAGEAVSETVEQIVERTILAVDERRANKAKMEALAAARAAERKAKMEALAARAGR